MRGGMENQSFQLINGFTKTDNEVYSIIYKGGENKLLFFLKLKSRVKRILNKNNNITIVHFNDGLMALMAILFRIDFKGLPLTATFHGLDVVFPLYIYQKLLLPLVSKKLSKIICVSNATRKACLDRNIEACKLVVVNNGIDNKPAGWHHDDFSTYFLDQYNIDVRSDKIILAIGRPVKRKGFGWFAENVMPLIGYNFKFVHIGPYSEDSGLLKKLFPDKIYRLYKLFVGYPDDSDKIKKMSETNPERVILTGNLSDDKRDYLIRVAKIVIMPNIDVPGDMEGFGLVALETSVQGKIVLGADIEGIRDAIHAGKNGYLIPSGNAWAWSEYIMLKTDNGPIIHDSIRKYTLENFNLDKMIREYSAVFENLNTCRPATLVS